MITINLTIEINDRLLDNIYTPEQLITYVHDEIDSNLNFEYTDLAKITVNQAIANGKVIIDKNCEILP